MKKLLLSIGALGAVLIALPMFAAFEAHVINVTAKIENALSVDTSSIDFGTVFPQEHLEQPLIVQLSSSFVAEDRVDDVNYIIRQKPKCGWTLNDGTNLLGIPTMSGHVDREGNITCPESDWEGVLPQGAVWGPLPLLCPYLSKHPDGLDDRSEPSTNDVGLKAFHEIGTTTQSGWDWNDVIGRLAKSENDTVDNWVIDLAVPCFGDYCAQDWAEFIGGHNEAEEVYADNWVQPIENEHKIFGCDLWVEVTGVSCDYSVVATGESYEGEFGSTVTPVKITNTNCSVVNALKLEHSMNYQQGQPEGQPAGWAGWSCVEPGYREVVGGGVTPEGADVYAQGAAEFGAPAVDGNNYPNYPHYTFNGGVNADGGEEGWVVEAAGTTPPTSIYALCST